MYCYVRTPDNQGVEDEQQEPNLTDFVAVKL